MNFVRAASLIIDGLMSGHVLPYYIARPTIFLPNSLVCRLV